MKVLLICLLVIFQSRILVTVLLELVPCFKLVHEYNLLRGSYCGFPIADKGDFDTELVSQIIMELKHGKAADYNGPIRDFNLI